MNHIRTLSAAVVLILAVTVLGGCAAMGEMDALVANPDLHTPDLSTVADGTYKGTYKSGLVAAAVTVTVRSHAFADITITKHDTGKGQPAEAIVNTVVDRQSLAVDTVAGATVSSLVILKAIEQAFAQL